MSVLHAKQPISQERGDMAKVRLALVVEGDKCLAPSLAADSPLCDQTHGTECLGIQPGVAGERETIELVTGKVVT